VKESYDHNLDTAPTYSANANKIKNIFAATLPRKRVNPVNPEINQLQNKQYKDDLADEEYQQQLQSLIASYQDIFDTESTQSAKVPEIHIDLKPEYKDKRFFRPEPLRSIKEQKIIDDNALKLIKQGKAKMNPTSIHNLGQVIVPRYDKDGNELVDRARVCIDARPVNKGLVPYRYPIPNIKKILIEMSKKKYFSEIDLSDSFQQLPISDELSDLLTVTTSFGKVSCTRLTYGVQFATDVFQETMTLEFMEFLESWLMIYVDNMQLKTDTKKEHLVALEQLFLRMRILNIKCRKEKCIFMVESIRTMGFLVQHGVIKPDPQKLDMLKRMPEPTTKQQLKAYLGLLQFYRDMLPHLAHTAYQLYAATSENYTFQWTDKLSEYFHLTKTMLEKEILNTNLEGDKDIKVFVDASKSAVCAVITQRDKIVACTSKVLNPAQRRWSTIERELYAISWGLKKLRFYLHGTYFEIFTDHKPLLGLVNKDAEPPNNRIATMLLSIAEHTFQLIYLPGSRNVIADFGTRNLDVSEWDKNEEEDHNGLHKLFHCSITGTEHSHQTLTNFWSSKNITESDKEEIKKYNLEVKKEENFYTVMVKGKEKIWVPTVNRRALFWALHEKLHHGSAKVLDSFHQLGLYWPLMAKDIENYLSQCLCTTKKTRTPHKYSEKVKIAAKHPLHILAIDLYNFGEHIYFTAICIFTKFSWVKHISDKQAETVLKAYLEFCCTFSEPELISCDNGGEFNLIETEKTNHPSEHPAANGIIERFHQELGKLSRIHNLPPDQVYDKLNTTSAEVQFNSYLKAKYSDNINCVISYQTRRFHYNDLVWRCIPKRKREKQQDTYTGPHRILKQIGKFSYEMTSHLKRENILKVNINDIKILHIPDTENWTLNNIYFEEAISELGSTTKLRKIFFDIRNTGAFILDIMAGKNLDVQFFVIPDWPCMNWYNILHEEILAEAVRLPKRPDLFLNEKALPMGGFAWDYWLFELR
jgi:hypothetical protein